MPHLWNSRSRRGSKKVRSTSRGVNPNACRGEVEQAIGQPKQLATADSTSGSFGLGLLVAALKQNHEVFDADLDRETKDLRDSEAMCY